MGKILVVDDDRDFVEATIALLEAKNHVCIAAYSGEEGYHEAVKNKPDVILLDVMMAHDSEGFDIARRLKENPVTKHIPVIMITGIRRAKGLPFSFEPDEDWLPVKAVLEKPVKPEVLLKEIAAVLK